MCGGILEVIFEVMTQFLFHLGQLCLVKWHSHPQKENIIITRLMTDTIRNNMLQFRELDPEN